jgi:hypothetical protein
MTASTQALSERELTLHHWLHQQFNDYELQIDSLPGDASFRRYHRLCLTAKAGEQGQANTVTEPLRYIVMDAPPEMESIVEFVAVDELLAATINVPTIIAKDMTQGFLVLQDFGTTEFAHLVADAPAEIVDNYYKQAIDTLLQLQTIVPAEAQLPHYDAAMLEREMDLFSDWFIPYVGVPFAAPEQQCWQALKQAVIEQVLAQPSVIVHRDYHSRNLMQDCADAERLGVIDFQDAVIGAYSYDLSSLLRDAYVDWSEAQIAGWIQYYSNQLASANIAAEVSDITVEQLTYDLMVMGMQRHLKILGIFVRLSERDGKARYLADIPKVMRDLLVELTWLSQQNDSPIAAIATEFKAWLEDMVMPAFKQKFAA